MPLIRTQEGQPDHRLADVYLFGCWAPVHKLPVLADCAGWRRHGPRDGPRDGLAWDHPVLDTVLLSAVLFGANKTNTFDALCARLEVTIPESARHTALGDAQARAEVVCRMLPMFTSRGFTTFGDVIAQTRKHGRLLQDLNQGGAAFGAKCAPLVTGVATSLRPSSARSGLD